MSPSPHRQSKLGTVRLPTPAEEDNYSGSGSDVPSQSSEDDSSAEEAIEDIDAKEEWKEALAMNANRNSYASSPSHLDLFQSLVTSNGLGYGSSIPNSANKRASVSRITRSPTQTMGMNHLTTQVMLDPALSGRSGKDTCST